MARSLLIGISARAMSHPHGGVKEYVTAITRELVGIGSRHRFSIYYADQRLCGTNPEAVETYLAAPHKLAWDHWVLPRRLEHERPDVVWFPQNVSSLGLSLPTVVSVMDMIYFAPPGCTEREYAVLDTLYMRTFIPRSLRRARRIMTISDWTAHDIVQILGIPRDKMQTIHLAANTEFRPASSAEREAVRSKFGLVQPYFFNAGVLSYRKNLRVLLEAFGRIKNDVAHDLVLTGGPGFLEVPLDDIIATYGIGDRVRRLGKVSQTDLIRLYSAADAFVFPSRYEGFGIPPLEAFACGCPVISSNATSLSEVVGDAALTFDPMDVDTLAQHLRAVAGDAALRAGLVRAGFERVKGFSYTRAAKELLSLLEDAAL
jgi:glycosyltransferase involved in cell wall biosynthesis